MKRRSVFQWLAGAAGALGWPGLAQADGRPAAAPPPPPLPPAPLTPEAVHYINVDQRHIEAQLFWKGGGSGVIEYEMRPAVRTAYGVVTSRQRVEIPVVIELNDPFDARPHAGTWHAAAGCPCGRAYSEWWYGRQRKQALLDQRITLPPDQGVLGTGFSYKPEGHTPGVVAMSAVAAEQRCVDEEQDAEYLTPRQRRNFTDGTG